MADLTEMMPFHFNAVWKQTGQGTGRSSLGLRSHIADEEAQGHPIAYLEFAPMRCFGDPAGKSRNRYS